MKLGDRELPLPPTHPDGPRAQVVLCQQCNHPTTGGWHVGPSTVAPECDCCSWRQNDPAYVPPEPQREIPAGWSPEKWAAMPRRERRAAERAARKRR